MGSDGREQQKLLPSFPTGGAWAETAAGEAEGQPGATAVGSTSVRPQRPSSLEGLPLLPELLHRAGGWGWAHILLGFP